MGGIVPSSLSRGRLREVSRSRLDRERIVPHIIDRLYFTRRAEQSRMAMGAAAGAGARLAHRQLARAYATLAAPSLAAPHSNGREALARWADDGGFPR